MDEGLLWGGMCMYVPLVLGMGRVSGLGVGMGGEVGFWEVGGLGGGEWARGWVCGMEICWLRRCALGRALGAMC